MTPVRVEDVEPRGELSDASGPRALPTSARTDGFIQGNGRALRYGIGVGRENFTWSGQVQVCRKAAWLDWRPPPEVLQRQPHLPRFMAGGTGTLDAVKQRGTLQCRLNHLWSMGSALDAPLLPWKLYRPAVSGARGAGAAGVAAGGCAGDSDASSSDAAEDFWAEREGWPRPVHAAAAGLA